MSGIAAIQNTIAEEFSMLDGNQELTLDYLMDLGSRLEPLTESDYHEDHLVKGCQSKVWLISDVKNGRIYFKADSNTAITKGLVSLLVRIFNGQEPDEILDAEITFIRGAGLDRFIGTQRSNGLAAMIKQIRYYALAAKAIPEQKG